jgi:hypothetical protein
MKNDIEHEAYNKILDLEAKIWLQFMQQVASHIRFAIILNVREPVYNQTKPQIQNQIVDQVYNI